MVNCKIKRLTDIAEELWLLTISPENIDKVLIQLIAYEYGKIPKVKLYDTDTKLSLIIEHTASGEFIKLCSLNLEETRISLNKTWFDAVVSMLLETSLFGWCETAHLDYEFINDGAIFSMCVSISPPAYSMTNDTKNDLLTGCDLQV